MNQIDAGYTKHLNKVLNSEGFISSPNLKNLLSYLFECSVSDNPPKEIQIAAEIFNKDLTEENNQDNAIVRVNVHNLRKKLEHYYLTDGKDDEIRFVIPKGRYEVQFVSIKPSGKLKIKPCTRFLQKDILVIYIVIILISFITSFFLFRSKSSQPNEQVSQSLIWKDLIRSDKKTMIVIGDYFFIKDQDTALHRTTMVRDFSINSYNDLTHFLNNNPGYTNRYSQAEFTFNGYSIPFVLKELIPLVCKNDFEITLMSQFNAKYLHDYNIIVIGLYKTLGYLKTFIDHSKFEINDDNMTVTVSDMPDTDKVVYTQEGQSEKFHDDYAIAAKLKGPNKNVIFLMSSFHDIGIVECAKQLTNVKTLDQIEETFQSAGKPGNGNFEILFKVLGVNRNDLKSEIIKINLLDSNPVFDTESR